MTPATNELDAAGVAYTVHRYAHDDGDHGFGREAADRLEIDPDRVFKTLIVVADGAPAVAIVPVSRMLGLKAAARALGVKRVEMCDPIRAERITGYVRGGISPFGQKRQLTVVIDETVTAFETVFVSGGKRGLDIALAPTDLIAHLDATVATIAVT